MCRFRNLSGILKASYKHDYFSVSSDVDLNPAGPVVNACAVLGYEGWLAGYQMSFDTGKTKLTKSNFAVGFSGADFTVHTNVLVCVLFIRNYSAGGGARGINCPFF